MPASNAQVQQYCDDRIRPRAEEIRALLLRMKSDKAAIDDVYANVNDGGSTFADTRADAPPHLLLRTDVLAFNTLITNLIDAIEDDAQWPVVQSACVRAPEG